MVGRIHRLGQSQQVLIKKFALRNSINENIVVLHERIKTGQTWGQIPPRLRMELISRHPPSWQALTEHLIRVAE